MITVIIIIIIVSIIIIIVIITIITIIVTIIITVIIKWSKAGAVMVRYSCDRERIVELLLWWIRGFVGQKRLIVLFAEMDLDLSLQFLAG